MVSTCNVRRATVRRARCHVLTCYVPTCGVLTCCVLTCIVLACFAIGSASAVLSAQQVPRKVAVPIEYHKLDNGLKVVLSRGTSSPTVVVGVYYAIGFRVEPKGAKGALVDK